DINWVVQQEQLGTGHAVKICEQKINSEYFLMIYGDIFTSPDIIKNIINIKKMKVNSEGIIAAKRVNNPTDYGCLEIKNDYLVKIHEKHPQPPSQFINAGIMILPSLIFDRLTQTSESRRGEIELTDGINQLINNKILFSLYYIDDYWIDIGYPWNLLTANELGMKQIDFIEQRSSQPSVTIEGPIKLADTAVLRPGSFIQGPVIIDNDAVVGPNCFIRSGSYLGKNVRIGNAVEVKNSIILDNTRIGHLSYIGDSIIGTECNFGAGTKVANLKLTNTEIKMTVKGEQKSTGRSKLGVIMGDKVKTGINVSLMPGIIIGENSMIGAHTLVTEDIPPNTLYYQDPQKGIIKKSF
ncbi:MAG: bifunctional sugar-1-phosphate nucleotidylyltransferase/acetyltransferase, partial [Candidatus Hodarchaeales archaeon]